MCQSNAFMKGVFTLVTGRLVPGVLGHTQKEKKKKKNVTYCPTLSAQKVAPSHLSCTAGAVVTKTITLQADQWFLGSWQALVRLLACSCSLSGSFHTLCSGASWWLPVSSPWWVPRP